MLLLAASLGFALLNNSGQLSGKDEHVWGSAKSSIALVLRNGIPCGEAVLIDKSGLFLASKSTVDSGNSVATAVPARLADGRTIILDWRATDVPTDSVLLQAEDWTLGSCSVVTLHPVDESLSKVPVVVVLPSGPVRGELISDNRVAVVGQSKRMFPLGEVSIEASAQTIGGALVFDEAGRLFGVLNATLVQASSAERIMKIAGPQKGIPSVFSQSLSANPAFGPGDRTTGYTIGPQVLRRVVSGFLSPTHKVLHPAIGISCKDSLGGGALVVTVKPGSPAEKAGMLKDDLLVKMDDLTIKNQFDFARVIESKEVGDPLTVVVMRGGAAHTFKLTVGTMQKAPPSPDSLSQNPGIGF